MRWKVRQLLGNPHISQVKYGLLAFHKQVLSVVVGAVQGGLWSYLLLFSLEGRPFDGLIF